MKIQTLEKGWLTLTAESQAEQFQLSNLTSRILCKSALWDDSVEGGVREVTIALSENSARPFTTNNR